MSDLTTVGKRVVIMGDIGWSQLYHVGDEAMTEVALDQVRAAGITDVVLIAAEPEVASARYGATAVPRFHFKRQWPRSWHDSHLQKVLAPLDDYSRGDGAPATVIDAVHDADVVIIAGGGNMTSQYVHQLYERLALVRVSKHFDKPVLISSQTLGATFRTEDRAAVTEVLQYASIVGIRERTSLETARSLADVRERVFYTGDDALLLSRTHESESLPELPQRYIVASFERPIDQDDAAAASHLERVGRSLEAVSQRLDCAVVLIPHAGSFDPTNPKDDVRSHSIVSEYVTRSVECPTIDARSVAEIMRGALLSLSTRYHPLVFAAAEGVPAIGFADSAYTWNRMVGASRQYGAGDTVLPTDVLADPDAVARIADSLVYAGATDDAFRAVVGRRIANQERWWKFLVATILELPAHFESEPDPDQTDHTETRRVLAGFTQPLGAALGRAEEELRWQGERFAQRSVDVHDLREALTREQRATSTVLTERDAALGQAAELAALLEEERSARSAGAEALREAQAEQARWRRSALAYRREVQRHRDRRITRLADALGRMFRRGR